MYRYIDRLNCSLSEISNLLSWKLLGSVTGNTESINLPSSYNELLISAMRQSTDDNIVTFHIIKQVIDLSTKSEIALNNINVTNDVGRVCVLITNKTSIKLYCYKVGDSDATSITKMSVYYR